MHALSAVCVLQLYNEDINDLLAPENQKLQVSPHTAVWGAALA